MNYKITLEVQQKGGKQTNCYVVVWRKLSGEHEMTEGRCDESRSTRQINTTPLLGGFRDRDTNDEDVQKAASFAFEKLSSGSGSSMKFVRVVSAKSQVCAAKGLMHCKRHC